MTAKESPETPAGWTPPVICDWTSSAWRAVTQEDVDKLLQIAHCYGELRKLMRDNEAELHLMPSIFWRDKSK